MSSDAAKPIFKSVEVNIFNQVYSLRTNRDAAQIKRIANLVDERMRLISAHATTHDLAKVAVFAALNIADELSETKEYYERELQALLARSLEQERAAEEQAAEIAAAQEALAAERATAAAAREDAASLSDGASLLTGEQPSVETKRSEQSPVETKSDEPPPDEAKPAEPQSWFEAIFDAPETARDRGERLSSKVSAKLQSLRQPNPDAPLTIEEDN